MLKIIPYFAQVIQMHNGTKIYKKMNKTLKLEQAIPLVLPQGWKKEVASTLGVHRNTVSNALRAGSGQNYDRIIKCALAKYGKIINVTEL